MWFLLGLATGLVIGWNFLPQPAWVKDKVEGLKSKLGM